MSTFFTLPCFLLFPVAFVEKHLAGAGDLTAQLAQRSEGQVQTLRFPGSLPELMMTNTR